MDSRPTQHSVTGVARTAPAHAVRRPPAPAKALGGVAALVALVAAALVIAALAGRSEPSRSTPTSAKLMTVSTGPGSVSPSGAPDGAREAP